MLGNTRMTSSLREHTKAHRLAVVGHRSAVNTAKLIKGSTPSRMYLSYALLNSLLYVVCWIRFRSAKALEVITDRWCPRQDDVEWRGRRPSTAPGHSVKTCQAFSFEASDMGHLSSLVHIFLPFSPGRMICVRNTFDMTQDWACRNPGC